MSEVTATEMSKLKQQLTQEILNNWRSRFPNNMYAWPGAPESFAAEASNSILSALSVGGFKLEKSR